MGKREVLTAVSVCDCCGTTGSYMPSCDGCGKDICYDCEKTNAKEYPHAVHFSGSDDGLYCLECDVKLMRSGDKRHIAYCAIERLRQESKDWNAAFNVRVDLAERALKSLPRKQP